MAYSLSADVSDHVTFVFIPPPTRALAVRVVKRIPNSTKCATSKCTAVDAQCAATISPACLIELYNISTMPASASGNSLGVSMFDNEVANKDDIADLPQPSAP
ncbi:hypothetical protein VTO73DRAFT_10832 [Trametes versicolor]